MTSARWSGPTPEEREREERQRDRDISERREEQSRRFEADEAAWRAGGGKYSHELPDDGGDEEPDEHDTTAPQALATPAAAPASAALPPAPEPAGKDKAAAPSQATLLIQLAATLYDLGQTVQGRPFAVARAGGPARLFRGGKGGSLRAELAAAFFTTQGKSASSTALADALTTLEGFAVQEAPSAVHLRAARHEGGIVLDLGDDSGRAVIVRPGGWELVDTSPVLFRRTGATAPLPVPERGGNLAELRAVLNVSDASWPLLVGWMLAALLPDVPCPVLALSGVQGTGKTTAARMVVQLVDASGAPMRSVPRDERDWSVAADASRVVALDNLSGLPAWLSDALCKAVTGDGMVTRALYSDDDLVVRAFRRAVVLTSIDLAASRGDLGERLVSVELERIPDANRREDAEVQAAYAAMRPRVLGALLDLLAAVLDALPAVRLDRMPRMADFARLLAALDQVTGWGALPAYLASIEDVSRQMAEGDPIALAISDMVRDSPEGQLVLSGQDLLHRLSYLDLPPQVMPRTPRAVTGVIKRAEAQLRSLGVTVEKGTRGSGSASRAVLIFSVGAARTAADAADSAAHAARTAGLSAAAKPQVSPEIGSHAADAACPRPTPLFGLDVGREGDGENRGAPKQQAASAARAACPGCGRDATACTSWNCLLVQATSWAAENPGLVTELDENNC